MTTSRLDLNRVVLLKNLSSYMLKRIWKGLAGARLKRESHVAQSASTRQSALKDSFWVSNRALARYTGSIHWRPIICSSFNRATLAKLSEELLHQACTNKVTDSIQWNRQPILWGCGPHHLLCYWWDCKSEETSHNRFTQFSMVTVIMHWHVYTKHETPV